MISMSCAQVFLVKHSLLQDIEKVLKTHEEHCFLNVAFYNNFMKL